MMSIQQPVWSYVPIPVQAPARTGVASLPEARLWYWDTGGNGEPVVFLHPASQSGAGWVYQQPFFAGQGYRAIGYSRRGYAGSPPGDPASPGTASGDLDALLSQLDTGAAHLVAVAHGAFFAIDFALCHPDKVRSLTLASSYLGVDPCELEYAEANARLRPKEFEALPVEIRELHPSYRAGNPAGLAEWLGMHRQSREVGPLIEQRRVHRLTWAALERLRAPTLLVTGDGDLYSPPALLRMQARHLHDVQMSIIAEAGHAPHWEQPQAFNQRVLDFIGSVRTLRGGDT